MAATGDGKSRGRQGIEEHRERAIKRHAYGIEEQLLHSRGLRGKVLRTFYKENGDIDIGLTTGQAILDTFTAVDNHASLNHVAEQFLIYRGEESLFTFFDRFENFDFNPRAEIKYDILSQIWMDNITSKYGPVSKEAFAARFISSSASVLRVTQKEIKETGPIFSLCEAWHLWQSECDGEHEAAARHAKSQSNLRKAGPARIGLRAKRVALVREEASKLWAQKPNYRRNANGTAGNIHEVVNRRLREENLTSYTLGTLIKVVGTLIKKDTPVRS